MPPTDDGGLGALAARVADLTVEVRDVRGVMEVENVKRDERIATNKRATETANRSAAIGVGVGLAAVLVAVFAIWVAVHFAHQSSDRGHALQAQIVKNEADRAAARVTGCTNYNDQQRAAYHAEYVQARVLVRALVPNLAQADPETRRRVTAFLIEHDTQSAISHQERDCSPDGIARYYEHPPTSPNPPVPSVTTSTAP
jgi:hypothetical protein